MSTHLNEVRKKTATFQSLVTRIRTKMRSMLHHNSQTATSNSHTHMHSHNHTVILYTTQRRTQQPFPRHTRYTHPRVADVLHRGHVIHETRPTHHYTHTDDEKPLRAQTTTRPLTPSLPPRLTHSANTKPLLSSPLLFKRFFHRSRPARDGVFRNSPNKL